MLDPRPCANFKSCAQVALTGAAREQWGASAHEHTIRLITGRTHQVLPHVYETEGWNPPPLMVVNSSAGNPLEGLLLVSSSGDKHKYTRS